MDISKALTPTHHSRRILSRGITRSDIKELLLLLIVDREGPIGRYRLKDMLGLSGHEGSVRQMLVNLQSQGYLSPSRSGCILTSTGTTFLESRLASKHIAAIKRVGAQLLTVGPVTLGVHLRNRADYIESAMDLRDLAVRGGATGATILLFKEGELSIPSVHPDFLSDHPNLIKDLQEIFTLEEDDVIALISAEDEWIGIEAAITLAGALCGSKR